MEVVHDADGKADELATLGPGDFFGEMALFEGFPRNATVRATEDTECLAMTRWDFTAEMKNHPEIAVGMIPVLVRRLATWNRTTRSRDLAVRLTLVQDRALVSQALL